MIWSRSSGSCDDFIDEVYKITETTHGVNYAVEFVGEIDPALLSGDHAAGCRSVLGRRGAAIRLRGD